MIKIKVTTKNDKINVRTKGTGTVLELLVVMKNIFEILNRETGLTEEDFFERIKEM